ncbi:MAG: Na(+)-translocating NADH-quinone reductase subunit A [Acidobacteriota bacterium]
MAASNGSVHKIKKGLELPITGQPEQRIDTTKAPARVAVMAAGYHGMKPTMHVQPGDSVRRGQLLFEDKKTPGVRYTSPAGGKIVAVNRGDKRALQSVVVELDDEERSATGGATVRFEADTGKHPAELQPQQVRDLLIESGQWTALRTRPYNKVPAPDSAPAAVFVTAADSAPLAPKVSAVLEGREDDFERGLVALGKLTDGPVFVCTDESTAVPLPSDGDFRHERFSGHHPSGTVGMHIHTLMPVDRNRTVWHIGYQDVLAYGVLFRKGEIDVGRVIAIAGPIVSRPRLVRTRMGASTDDLLRGEIQDGIDADSVRPISGSVFSGRYAAGEVLGFLGRFTNQLSVLREGNEREFLGWLTPGADRFSLLPAFISALMPKKKFDFTTSTQGSHRAIVPIGLYEKVFPFDMVPTYLLKTLVVHDVEHAERLGVLELDEEDIALCSFVCPGKIEYGAHLRDVLTTLEKEG